MAQKFTMTLRNLLVREIYYVRSQGAQVGANSVCRTVPGEERIYKDILLWTGTIIQHSTPLTKRSFGVRPMPYLFGHVEQHFLKTAS